MKLIPLDYVHLQRATELRNLPETLTHTRNPRIVTQADTEAWWVAAVKQGASLFAVEDRDGYGMVGIAGLVNADWLNQSAEITLVCEPTDLELPALKLLLAYGFDRLNLHRIWAECYTPRRRLLVQDAGFSQEGTLRDAYRRDGAWHNSTLHAILERDYAH